MTTQRMDLRAYPKGFLDRALGTVVTSGIFLSAILALVIYLAWTKVDRADSAEFESSEE